MDFKKIILVKFHFLNVICLTKLKYFVADERSAFMFKSTFKSMCLFSRIILKITHFVKHAV